MVEADGVFGAPVHAGAGAGAGQVSHRPSDGAADGARAEPAPLPDIGDRAVRPAGPGEGGGERYTRQVRLPELGEEGQRRLAASRVAVIGAGGLGAPVLSYLAAAGVGVITVIDPDTVDPTNLHRQLLFTAEDVGRPKSEAAAERLRSLNPEVEVRAVVAAATADSARELLAGHDLVLDGSDNFPTRYLVSDACELLDLPLVWGSILAFSGQLSVFWGASGRGVTYRDLHPVPPRPGEVPSCSEAGVLGMLCGVIGSAMAMEAVKVLAGMGDALFGRLALYDALRARWDELPLARDPRRLPVTMIEDVAATCGLPGPTGPALDEVAPVELPELLAAGARLIDLREAHELSGGMIRGAEHVPMAELLAQVGEGEPADGRVPSAVRDELEGAVLYCAAGSRSAIAQSALAARGIRVLSLRGGFDAVRAGGPGITVVRPG